MNMIERGRELLDVQHFSDPVMPKMVGQFNIWTPSNRQYVLRMLIHRPGMGWAIPPNLIWTADLLFAAAAFQRQHFGDYSNRFIYITIRSGEVTTRTDTVWHVDGFSMRNSHVPEQNYIWSSNDPMEVCTLPINIPSDFDPMQHNIHQLFQDMIPSDYEPLVMPEKELVAIDTYHIHRRPLAATGKHRTMVRISFVPIQIETDDCEQNPMFPVEVFNRSDIRSRLTRYPVQGIISST